MGTAEGLEIEIRRETPKKHAEAGYAGGVVYRAFATGDDPDGTPAHYMVNLLVDGGSDGVTGMTY